MPDNNILFTVKLDDGRTEQWTPEQYEQVKDQFYGKYPTAQVTRTTVYNPDEGINNGDVFNVKLQDGRNETWTADQMRQAGGQLMQKYPDAYITKDSNMSQQYWQTKADEANKALADFDAANAEFMRDYQSRPQKDIRGSLTGMVNPSTASFINANKDRYDRLVAERDELLRAKYENPLIKNEYETSAQGAADRRDYYNDLARQASDRDEKKDWQRAAKLQDDIRKMYEAPSQDEVNGFAQYLNAFNKGQVDTFNDRDFYTSGLSAIARNHDLRNIAEKVQNVTSEKDVDQILSDSEKAQLMAFYNLAEAQRERSDDIASAYNAGQTAAESVKFMAEFLLSQGLANVAGKALSGTSNAVASWLGKQLMSNQALNRAIQKGVTTASQASKGIQWAERLAVKPVIQGLWHTGTQLSSLETISDGLMKTDNNGDLVSRGQAIGEGLLDSVIENWSESLGGAAEGLIAPKFAGKTPFGRFARWLNETGPAQVLGEAGFNGLLGEMAEEWAGNAVRVGLGLMSPEEFKDFASWEKQLEMAAAFAPMTLLGVGGSTAEAIRNSHQYNDLSGKVQDIMQRQGRSEDEIKDLLNTAFDTPEDIGKKLAPYLKPISENAQKNGATKQDKEDYKTMLDFARFLGMDAVMKEQDRLQQVEKNEGIKNNIYERVGRFWEGDDATPVDQQQVRIVTDADGKSYYVTASDANGVTGVDTITGEHKILNNGQYTEGETLPMADYLQQQSEALDKDTEQLRMQQDAMEQIDAVRQQVETSGTVPMGTESEEITAQVVQSNANGAELVWKDADGNEHDEVLPWTEIASKLGTPIVVKTDAELKQDAADAYDKAVKRLETYKKIPKATRMVVNLEDVGPVELQYAGATIEEGQVMLYGRDEQGQDALYPEELVTNLEEMIAAPMEEEAQQSPFAEGEKITFVDSSGKVCKGTVTDDLKGGQYVSVRLNNGWIAIVSKDKIELDNSVPRDFSGKPLPLRKNTATGQVEVDSDKLWQDDPEAWTEWNDTNPNQDVSSDKKLAYNISALDDRLAVNTTKVENLTLKGGHQEEVDAIKADMQRDIKRRELLQSLLDGRVAAAAARQAAAVEEHQLVAQPQQSKVPASEKGVKQYTEAPARATYEDIYNDAAFDDADEAYGFILGKVANAKAQVNKAQDALNKVKQQNTAGKYATTADYKQAKDKAVASLDAAQAELDYWNSVKDLADADIERAKKIEQLRENELSEPKSLHQLVANAFIGYRNRLNKESFKKETGYSDADLKPFFQLWAKKGQGSTVLGMAEDIAANDDSGLVPFDDNGHKDIQAVRDAILEVFQQASSPSDLYEYTYNQNVAVREAEQAFAESQQEAPAVEVSAEPVAEPVLEPVTAEQAEEAVAVNEPINVQPQMEAAQQKAEDAIVVQRIADILSGKDKRKYAQAMYDHKAGMPEFPEKYYDEIERQWQEHRAAIDAQRKPLQKRINEIVETAQKEAEAEIRAKQPNVGETTLYNASIDIVDRKLKGSEEYQQLTKQIDELDELYSPGAKEKFRHNAIGMLYTDFAQPAPGDALTPAQRSAFSLIGRDSEQMEAEAETNMAEDIFADTLSQLPEELQSSEEERVQQEEPVVEAPINQPEAAEEKDALADLVALGDEYAERERQWEELLDKRSEGSVDEETAAKEMSRLRAENNETERKMRAIIETLDEDQLAASAENPNLKELVKKHREGRERRRRLGRLAAFISKMQKVPKKKAKAQGKFAPYKYVSNDATRPAMNGVYHDNGYAVAGTIMFLVADKESYDKSKNGKIIDKQGKEIEAQYPKWREILPSGGTKAKINFSALRDFLAGVRAEEEEYYEKRKAAGEKVGKKKDIDYKIVIVNVGNDASIAFKLGMLEKFADYAEHIGAKDIQFTDDRHAVMVKNNKGVALIMPVMVEPESRYKNEEEYAREKYKAYGYRSFGENEYQKQLATASEELTEAQKKSLAFVEGKTTEQVEEEHKAKKAEEKRLQSLRDRIAKWKEYVGDIFEVLESIDDVAAIEDAGTREQVLRAMASGQSVEGWYNTRQDKAYIFLPDIKDVKMLDRKVIHEVLAHKGLRALLGEERYNKYLDHVWENIMDEEARQWGLDYNSHLTGKSEAEQRRAAADEFIAHVAENDEAITRRIDADFWDKLEEFLKNLINDMVGADIFKDATWFHEDLSRSLQQFHTAAMREQEARAADERKEDVVDGIFGGESKVMSTAEAQENPQVPVARSQEKYEDFGEKIGMARKDTATTTGKKGDKDSRPAWMKKYQTINVERVSDAVLDEARRRGIRTNGFVPSAEDIVRGTDFSKPFIAFYEEKSKSRYGMPRRRYITGEDRQPIIFTSQEQYESTLPVFEVKDQGYRVIKKGGKFFIVRLASNNKLVEYAQFNTREEAVAYLASPEGCTDMLNRKRENYELPALEVLTRNNMPDYRKGKDVTPDDILKTFGFRGGEFGNWLNAEERQQFLNYAYDAFMDLAQMLGLSPRALSLNGELSIAFGARGQGGSGAAAHYESTRAVINLTKMYGAGSLAHEWAHALDNYFGLMDAKRERIRDEKEGTHNHVFLSEGRSYRSGVRKEVLDAFSEVMRALTRKTVTRKIELDKARELEEKARNSFEYYLKQVRDEYERGLTTYKYNRKTKQREEVKYKPTEEQLAEFDRLTAMLPDDKTFGWQYTPQKNGFRASGEVAEKLYTLVKDVMSNRAGQYGPLHNLFYATPRLQTALARLKDAQDGKTETVTVDTDFMEESKWFDRGRASDYWTKDLEMFARALESVLANRMKEQGKSSDYLTYLKAPLYASAWGHVPYPVDDELKVATEAFDKLFNTIQERVDETTGNTVLFSKASITTGDGAKVNFQSLGGLPAGAEHTSVVERTYSKEGAFSFTGKNKIETAGDVAFIFKELEDAAVENSFIVYVKEGVPTILHTGIGNAFSTFIDKAAFVAGINDFAPDEVYMVHNHPSGNVVASNADVTEIQVLQRAAGNIPVYGVIIDTVSGEYGQFSSEEATLVASRSMRDEGDIPIEVHSFNKLVFSEDYRAASKERPITRADDIASYLSAHRLGTGSKVCALMLNRSNRVVGNLVLNESIINADNAAELAAQAANVAIHNTAQSVVLFGDFAQDARSLSVFRRELARASARQVELLDVVRVEGNRTLSLEEGTLRDVTEEEILAENLRFSKVTDPELLDKLNNGKTFKAYRAMALIDGKLYSPMATQLRDERGRWALRQPTELGEWEQSDEHPEKAIEEDGKWLYRLKKPDGSTVDAAYNPYIHTSLIPLNDQFTAAHKRPELVTVEVEVPESELTSGYKAEKAKDAVGKMAWHAGPVAGQLPEGRKREVVLSRYDKPVRIVPDSEVADKIVEAFDGVETEPFPWNVFTPSLREELRKRGVQFSDEAAGTVSEKDQEAYKEWKAGQDNVQFSRVTPEQDAEYLEAVNAGDMKKAQQMVDDAARAAGYIIKAYHGTKADFNSFRYNPDDVGFHFGDKKTARNRIGRGTDTKLMHVALKINNPLVFTEDLGAWDGDYIARHMFEKGMISEQDARDILMTPSGWERGSREQTQRMREYLIDKGYDALEYPNWYESEEQTPSYAILRRENIKSADPVTYDNDGNVIPLSERFNEKNGDIRFSRAYHGSLADFDSFDLSHAAEDNLRFSKANANQDIFISNAEFAVEAIPMEKATPQQWLKMIESKGGLKAGEDKWIGLSDWLKEQDAKTLTKQDVLDYINENKIQIEETNYYSENASGFNELREEYDQWLREEGYDYAREQLIERFGDDAEIAFDYLGGELVIANEKAAAALLGSENIINPTRLEYTTEGLDNKREIALTVPTIEPWNESDHIHFGDAGEGRAVAWIRFGDAERDGQRVLFIDEIQSKRHQEGREKGYLPSFTSAVVGDYTRIANDLEIAPITDKMGQKIGEMERFMGDWYYVIHKDGARSPGRGTEREALDFAERDARSDSAEGRYGIPTAPFEKNWHELAMKRMLRLAAENGYDYVAWTTGEQQAERYALSNTVKSISSRQDGDVKNVDIDLSDINDTVHLKVDESGNVLSSDDGEFVGKKLADIVGKEIALRLMTEDTIIDGENMKIGGEGMKGFYDEILPRFMNKYGKKWGVKTEDIFLSNIGDDALAGIAKGVTAHAVRITPEMKESVMEGQLMFSKSDSAVEKAREGGIGAVIGQDNVGEYYREIYRAMPQGMRREVIDDAMGNGLNIRKATETALSTAARKGYAEDNTGLLRSASKMLDYYAGEVLTPEAARYILWRGERKQDESDIFGLAEDITMRSRNKIGQYAEPLRFSRSELKENLNAADEAAEATVDEAVKALNDGKKDLKDLLTATRAMRLQKEYDKKTVEAVINLAKQILKDQFVNEMSRREVARLLGLVRTSVGRSPRVVKRNADTIVEIVIENLLKKEKAAYENLIKKTGTKTNATGVEVLGELDIQGQKMLKAFKAGLEYEIGKIDDSDEQNTLYGMKARVQERLTSKDDAVRAEAEAEDAGLTLAIEYKENIKSLLDDEKSLKEELKDLDAAFKDSALSKKSYEEAVDATNDAIRANHIDQVEAYRDFSSKMSSILSQSAEDRSAFLENEKARIREIQHLANSDMQGRSASKDKRPEFVDKLANSPLISFFTAPLGTFDQMLRLFGEKSISGEGYLWNKFMNDWQKAAENEYKGVAEAREKLDKKVSEVFGEDMKWGDLFRKEIDKEHPKVKVSWWDDGKMVEHEMTQGQLLYIYMVNKMADGRMKLRRMGIEESTVNAIVRQMDDRFLTLADWLQNEFLVELRNKYNAVHERLFGASMAAIEDYFPLVINKRDINRNEDIGLSDDYESLPSTATGSIIKRRRNSKALDLLNADAFNVVLDHIDQMERWAAFAEFNKDLNALLSYKRFRNQVQNMASVYGSGTALWNNFKDVARIAGNAYHPTVKRNQLDTAAVNVAKGVTSAKISFRAYTALKQLLSMPAFVADANIANLAKSMATPKASWDWAMENLPLFEKRWKSRIAGDTRLMTTDMDWNFYRKQWYDKLSKAGMMPNAFVDAVTVAVGAKSIYDTKYAQYKKEGFSDEQADEKARRDATVLVNETQQSTENPFVSAVQLDRTVFTTMITVFRNSSMGFQRQVHDAIRNLGKHLKPGYKEESISFMKKQLMRDGLTEEQAEAAAERRYGRSTTRDLIRLATFGFLVEFAWNLGSSIVYLLLGDDDDKKKEMLIDAARHALIGGTIEGLSGGNVMSEALDKWAKGESLWNYDPQLLPLFSDIKNAYSKMSSDPVAGWNDIMNLWVQAGIGVNPQTLTDAVVAVADACNGDLGLTKEAMLMILRVMQVPQSQLDELYIDELGTTAGKARKMTYGQMAKRYADYKIAREAPLTGWAYSDEARKKREKAKQTTFKKKVNERKK